MEYHVMLQYTYTTGHGDYPLQSQPLGRQRQDDFKFKDRTGKVSKTLSQKQNKNKKSWGHHSSGTAQAQQVQGPQFNLQYCKQNILVKKIQ
jgi:hypothetical protein